MTRPPHAVVLGLLALLATPRVRAQGAACAAIEREADAVHAERAAASPADRRAVNERAAERLLRLRMRCGSPWVNLHLGLAEAALERWGEACFHLSLALASVDPRVERLRFGALGRAFERVQARTICPRPEPRPPSPPPAPPPATVAVMPTREVERGPSAARVLGWTGVGVGAAALATGAVFWGLTAASAARMRNAGASSEPRYRDFHQLALDAGESLTGVDLCHAAMASPSPRGAQQVCAEHALQHDLALGFGIGGAAVALAGVLIVVAAPEAPRAAVRVSGWFDGSGGGALAEGSF